MKIFLAIIGIMLAAAVERQWTAVLFVAIALGCYLVLRVHRAGVARSLRWIGSFFWGLASAYEHLQDRMREARVHIAEMEGQRVNVQ